jgi:hypothetical protein
VGVIDRYRDLKVAIVVFIWYGTLLHMGRLRSVSTSKGGVPVRYLPCTWLGDHSNISKCSARLLISVGDPDMRIRMFLGLQDPDLLVRGMDPDPDPSRYLPSVVWHRLGYKAVKWKLGQYRISGTMLQVPVPFFVSYPNFLVC